MRALLKVPIEAPSLLDLPTDRIQESDLADVLWRDPSGIDILLAPPRVEMAEMVTVRDLEKTLSLLRRVYEVVIVDTPAVVNDINLAFLDTSDTILEVVTYDSTAIHSTMVMADAFRMIGYPPTKVRYLVNRADSTGGIDPAVLSQALGRAPGAQRQLRRGARRAGQQRGHPVRARRPERADQPGRHAHGGRAGRAGRRPRRGGGRGGRVRPAAHRRVRLGRRRPHGAARDPAPHPARVHDLPRRQRARAVRRPPRRGGAPVLDRGRSTSWRRRDVKALVVACNTSTAVALRDLRARYDLPVLGVVRPGAAAAALATRNRRVGRDRDARDGPLPRVLQRDQGREPGGRGVRARDAAASCRWSRPGSWAARRSRRRSRRSSRRCSASATARASSCSRARRRAKIDTLLLGCTHYPLLRPVLARAVGDRVAIVDSATATAATLAELLSVNGLEAPGTTRGTAADAGRRRPRARRRTGTRRRATHVQLTTGDVERFREIATRMFGESFPDVGARSSSGRSSDGRTGRPERRPGARRIPEERLWQVGFVVGSVLGAAVTVAGRQIERSARDAGLVDWRRVEDIAIARLRNAPGSLTAVGAARDGARLRRGDGARSCRRSSAHLGTELPGVVDRVEVVDRAAWVAREHRGVRRAHRHARGRAARPDAPARAAGFAKATMTLANRWVTTRQLGLLLGFMGQRVLGQYDLALLSAETDARPAPVRRGEHPPHGAGHGRAARTRSGPGSRSTRRPTRSSSRRTRGCGRTSPGGWSASCRCSARTRRRSGGTRCRSLGRRRSAATGRRDDQHWMERLMSDEQRRLFRETQAIMSLLEGFGDHVMDEVGKDLVPGVERISARFHGRRQQRTPFERAMLRITGLDLKMEQYRKGEVFVAEIERLAGAAALRRLWDVPGDAADGRRDRATREAGSGGWASTRLEGGTRVTDGVDRARPGPGSGPGGAPAAIALTPILAARWRARDLEAIRAAAPGCAARHDRLRRPPRRAARRRRGDAPRPAARRTCSTGSSPGRRTCAGSTRRRRASSAC